MTKLEIRSIEDIANALEEIRRVIETHRNNLPKEERERIEHTLQHISRDEDIFKKNVRRVHRLFQRLGAVDAAHYKEIKERFERASGKEKSFLKGEIAGEEEKLAIERSVFELERKLAQALNTFNQSLRAASDCIRNSPYPYDANAHLSQAKVFLEGILKLIKETKELEVKLLSLIKAEKGFLKREREAG
jgi:hypothetical protein